MRLLLIDNYDSFAFNLYQALRVLGAQVEVVRNDSLSEEDEVFRAADGVVVSPGPKTPAEAGVSVAVCRGARVPLLGVCLGHQCLIEAFGGRVGRAGRILHGKTSPVAHAGRGLFAGMASPFRAARYHSLEAKEVPDCLEVTAATADTGERMAVRHKERPLFGVQFHPESFLTEGGDRLLRNFLDVVKSA